MKRAAVALGAIVVVLGLTGCNLGSALTTPQPRTVELNDGRTVECVVTGEGDSIDCLEPVG